MDSKTSIVEAELGRIRNSKGFRDSHQLMALLEFVVGETLAGREGGLKEYALGVTVFRRPETYDPRTDAIVRVQASTLRKRLAAYYEEEGRESPIRIDVPRGGYAARIEEAEPESAEEEPQVEAPAETAGAARGLWFALGLAAGLAIAAFLWWNRPGPQPASGALWGEFLSNNRPVVVTYGVPLFYSVGRGMFFRDVEVNTPEEEARGRLDQLPAEMRKHLRPQEDVYTGIGDAMGMHLVAQWLGRTGRQVEIANSNYLGASDIHGKNLVVVSSARFQTILNRLNLPERYHFVSNGVTPVYVVDSDGSASAEPLTMTASAGGGVNVSYALVTLWPGLEPGTRILRLSGGETWSTQAAAEFVLSPGKMAELERKLAADPAEKRSRYFQVLLQVEGKNNRPRSVTYHSHRYLPGG